MQAHIDGIAFNPHINVICKTLFSHYARISIFTGGEKNRFFKMILLLCHEVKFIPRFHSHISFTGQDLSLMLFINR